MSSPTLSPAQLSANQANALLSSGPSTTEGKAKSSMNALRTGLTGQTVLLPTDDLAVYEAFVDSLFAQWSPATDQENRLVQLIADTEWRVHKIAPLEEGIFAVGRLEYPDLFPEETDKNRRAGLINAKLQLIYEKQLRNLALQERRLRNQHKSDTAKLEQLQQERIANKQKAEQALIDAREAEFQRANRISTKCFEQKVPFTPSEFGFDFSGEEYSHYWKVQERYFTLTGEDLDFHQVVAAYRKAQKERPTA